ncbi:cytochrome P450 [Pedobacter cryoconitis]|uniref:Cytochrome P450 n=1 Tax=Pedobacter cryoconitis TaxID=188932 RepID=A0A7W8YVA6_9SPHI|nr:cytochrome P450 [Pedobacter cryoconitis]MBB5622451.1 cytochrome P450 [Pedobacter cryoconitis]
MKYHLFRLATFDEVTNQQLMDTGIILDWNTTEPHQFYAQKRAAHQVHYDKAQQSWIIYDYPQAKEALLNQDALIPQIKTDQTGLNQNAVKLIQQLARLSNFEQHQQSRDAALQIYNQMQPVVINALLDSLLKKTSAGAPVDWVEVVCKKLPALYILKSLGIGTEDCNLIIGYLPILVRIMSPGQTSEDILQLNELLGFLFPLLQKYLPDIKTAQNNLYPGEWTTLLISNLIGLLIQSYDAGRGLLTNTVLQLARHQLPAPVSLAENHFKEAVMETLRFDPPIHLTRRIAGKDLLIGDQLIKEGEMIIILLAAANLDPQIFESPLTYNPSRSNNQEHLAFGAGHHQCLAKHLTMHLTAETFKILHHRIQILPQSLTYEPLLNARLVKNLFITL